ncbi:MAG TPA: malto-oligosyltrehalose synthase [Actinomycetota bacterium]
MRIPTSTYRLQFGPGFGFADARRLVGYLRALGAGDLYASPLLRPRSGSAHGYDVVDPTQLNPDLGGRDGFDALAADLGARGMGLLLDIVPNHMATSDQNPWWWDALKHGRRSAFASFFDIDWGPGGGQVLAPVLNAPFGQVLEAGEIRLELSGDGEPVVRYGELRFPVDPSSYQGAPEDLPALNGRAGEPESFDVLEALLNRQHYRLADWHIAAREIDYRRFFDISDLVTLRTEDASVFEASHALVLDLARQGLVTGLRVDHVDGLLDPAGYADRLQRRLGEETGRDGFVVVEKILGRDEDLPPGWAVAGTTGYEFADLVDGLFVDPAGVERVERTHTALTGRPPAQGFEEVAARCQRLVLDQLFAGEGRVLAAHLHALALEDRHGRDLAEDDLRTALAEVMAWMPVYRTYTVGRPVADPDRRVVERAVREAIRRLPDRYRRAVEFVGRVLVLDVRGDPEWTDVDSWIGFVNRWQRLTGPVTAKGVEDTAMYRWDGLLSRSDVGAQPSRPAVSVEEFHRRMRERQRRWPASLNAGSTHDSKRSEDVRARLDVLSEVPEEWSRRVQRWRRLNRGLRRRVRGRDVPDPALELHLYQSLVGAWPLEPSERRDFTARMQDYAVKAAREAKVWTSWLAPDLAYERAVRGWLRAALGPRNERFRRDLESFAERVSLPGAVNSLAGVVLRATAPGVPDVYQGAELWNLALVDPDNRRPVDFERRMGAVEELDRGLHDRRALARDLAATWPDGRVKLHVLREALRLRRAHPQLFARGSYLPLEVTGRRRANALAFARRRGRSWAVAIVPRHVAGLARGGRFPVRAASWPATVAHLPAGAPERWTNVLTGEHVDAVRGGIRLADAFATLPVGVLIARS